MKYKKLTGIVVRSIDYLESDKLLTILSFEQGAVTIKAKSVRKKGAKLAYCAQQFFCGDFECIESHGKLIMTGGSRVYDYSDIANDLDKYYYACHFTDIALASIMEEHPDVEMLRLLLNALYLLTKDGVNLELLASIYEMRTAVLAGFAPVMDECVLCGSSDKAMLFSIEHGGIVCCAGGIAVDRHITRFFKTLSECDMKEGFSLQVPKESLKALHLISLEYLETAMDRKFSTLDSINIF